MEDRIDRSIATGRLRDAADGASPATHLAETTLDGVRGPQLHVLRFGQLQEGEPASSPLPNRPRPLGPGVASHAPRIGCENYLDGGEPI